MSLSNILSAVNETMIRPMSVLIEETPGQVVAWHLASWGLYNSSNLRRTLP